MAKEVSVQITSDAAFAKTQPGRRCERMQAGKARHQEGRKEIVGTTKEDPEELAKSSPKKRKISKFMGRQKQGALPKNERTKGPEQKNIERSKVWSWNKTRDGLISVERIHHKKGEEGSSAQRNGASKKEELCDYEEDKEPVIPTPALKASPEALGVWKRAQKMLAEACREMKRYQQMTERPRAHDKVGEENMVKSDDFDDPSLPDTNSGAKEDGYKDRCFRCGSTQHATSRCSAPGGHWINVLTDKTAEKT